MQFCGCCDLVLLFIMCLGLLCLGLVMLSVGVWFGNWFVCRLFGFVFCWLVWCKFGGTWLVWFGFTVCSLRLDLLIWCLVVWLVLGALL